MSRPKIAILVSFSGQGGVERMIANLSAALIDLGVELDILLIKDKGPHAANLPERARKIHLGSKHTATSIFAVARYLREERPDAMLAVKHRGILAALRARRLAGTDTPISGRLGTTVSVPLAAGSWLKRALWYRAMRRFYPMLKSVIAVSEGVAGDIRNITGLDGDQLKVVRNPVINDDLLSKATAPLDYPAMIDQQGPIILGAGRLTRQKDFPTLLRAFARFADERDAHLIILGDGEDRDALLALATDLGVLSRVSLPGFQTNPWCWMRRANVFALSSLWEGSPNSLTEALALGVPVVSTDCPSGPRELLQNGNIAPLVTMGDDQALAEAIEQMIDNPPSATTLQAAVAAYRAETSARRYLQALGIDLKD